MQCQRVLNCYRNWGLFPRFLPFFKDHGQFKFAVCYWWWTKISFEKIAIFWKIEAPVYWPFFNQGGGGGVEFWTPENILPVFFIDLYFNFFVEKPLFYPFFNWKIAHFCGFSFLFVLCGRGGGINQLFYLVFNYKLNIFFSANKKKHLGVKNQSFYLYF